MTTFLEPPYGYEFTDLTPDAPLWAAAVEVLAELRPALTGQGLADILLAAAGESLVFTACTEAGEVAGVAGWRVMTTTYADRKLHVDDLVVAEGRRSKGVDDALIEHLCTRGTQLGCTVIDLDSRVHRFDAHRFYLKERFDIAAHHFVRALPMPEIG